MRTLVSRHPVSMFATLAALVLGDGTALAAGPTTSECLAASHASLQLGHDHKLRAERSQLLVCAAPSCPADIRKDCLSHAEELSAQIPTVLFAAKDASGADIGDVKVTMDGESLVERLEGMAIAVDPGSHTFMFTRSDQPPVTKTFVIQEGQHDRRELVTLGSPDAAPIPPPPPSSTPAAGGGHGMGTQRIIALVVGGVGVVGLGLGAAFGFVAISKKNEAQSACPGQSECPTPDGVSKWNDVVSNGNVSTVAFIVGGVGLAAGVVLWLTAPSSSTGEGPQVGLGLGTLRVRGTW
jgi:hypothetical protein